MTDYRSSTEPPQSEFAWNHRSRIFAREMRAHSIPALVFNQAISVTVMGGNRSAWTQEGSKDEFSWSLTKLDLTLEKGTNERGNLHLQHFARDTHCLRTLSRTTMILFVSLLYVTTSGQTAINQGTNTSTCGVQGGGKSNSHRSTAGSNSRNILYLRKPLSSGLTIFEEILKFK
ncbi:hypothetical protein NQ318_013967 [Aromia moschata]|uniref:Uncharacterized protein n=1 Tax=Aromia moschata TaxID=1265417 RepID=A0AAV8YXZ1_9CUCU|nr:hypothetical protein NQ318_013967 [Aromia moschata]